MEDYMSSPKHDLRQTRFTQNNEHSYINIVNYFSQQSEANSLSIIEHKQSKTNNYCPLDINQAENEVQGELSQQNPQTKQNVQHFQKKHMNTQLFGCSQGLIDQKDMQKQTVSETESDQYACVHEQVQSERLDFIKSLQSKLLNIQQKISLSSITGLDSYRQKLDQQYCTYLNRVQSCELDEICHKKGTSHCFEEDQELHKTFQDLSGDGNKSDQTVQTVKILKTESKLKNNNNLVLEDDFSECGFTLSHTNQLMPANIYLNGESVLSINQESNASFHQKQIDKNKKGSEFYEEPDPNQTIVSRLLSSTRNIKEPLIEELENRVLQSQTQNIELKQQLSSHKEDIQSLTDQNQSLWREKQETERRLEEQQSSNYYLKQHIQLMRQDFRSEIICRQKNIKVHYQQIIDQLQNQQSQYSQRIIEFEELFEQKRQAQQRLITQLQNRDRQILVLEDEMNSRQLEILEIYNSRKDLEDMARSKEKDLREAIDELEHKNAKLQWIIQSEHSEPSANLEKSFDVLGEQAVALKATLEHMESMHDQELVDLESRYETLISRYQKQLERMKEQLGRVRLNKSSSVLDNSVFSHRPKSSIIEESSKNGVNFTKTKILDLSSSSECENSERLINKKLHEDELKQLIVKLRSENNDLSLRISKLQQALQKYASSLAECEQQMDQNGQVFKECVDQLEVQHQLNQTLKQKIQRLEQSGKSEEGCANKRQLLKMKKQNNKMKKYVQILQKEISQFAIIDSHSDKFRGYQETIQQLKKLVQKQII